MAFVGPAAGDEGLDDIRGIVYRDLHAVLVGLLEQLAASGHAVDGGVSAAARELQALIDGLTLHVLLGRVPAGSAERIVRAAVGRLVTRS
ncbi:TetR family transcriptional regulator C-terminal domain-containing protein [Micropruina sonneratiae]|uniref:TetR family transcriptional regulator C-terminal domain-containing protein n=1 Tax=Micropruina sonneratiae TaxID=2986940 RepID=UPI002226C6F0|nr:TetR family transcriptional regulator C-terminal domain-containing protein [Micropruina sp. KQZ13P-5]MCW3159286.1 TetR family transcriptional regulator C-terminal domain-containing protein [Micropruina sp. KQZ13P-5]